MKKNAPIIRKFSSAFICAFACVNLSGCSIFAGNQSPPEKAPKVYGVSFRQLPPAPVYNPVKLVYLPDLKPNSTPPSSKGVTLNPLVKLSLRDSTLEQAAIAMAAFGNYHSYTASTVAKQKINLEAYGTIDEVALELASKSGAHVVIDHPNKQIRILEQSKNTQVEPTEPRFLDEKPNSGVNNSLKF